MTTDATPGRRGTKPGTKQERNFKHVCPAPGCPLNGEPFDGTARAVFCSRACNLRAWRARQAKDVIADADGGFDEDVVGEAGGGNV